MIDNGTFMIKAGLASDDAPRNVFPAIVSRIDEQVLVGDKASSQSSMSHPIERGIVKDWEDMEKVWHHTFYEELRIAPEEYSILLTEPANNPKVNREKTTEIMFEKFNAPSLFLASQEALSLVASGRSTGLVLNCGEEICRAVPICEGHVLPHAICELEIGGKTLTDFLIKLLEQRGYCFSNTSSELEVVRDIKEKLTFVSLDFENEPPQTVNDSDSNEWGRQINIGNERFTCPEALFKPSLVGLDDWPGIDEIVFNSIVKCELELRLELYKNIVLAGGCSMFEGLGERLRRRLKEFIPIATPLKVVAPPERKYSAWIGGSIYSQSLQDRDWMDKMDYDEFGPAVVHRKCF